ncbi:MAG: response regulator [Eubacteriaceae bacterium]|jgi:YesN/AraC family two-component response regulator|nr:response regulator [Eubacteriaceae bacterium]
MLKALIADDESAVATIIKYIIGKEKLPIEIIGEAENGAEAVRLIKKEKPNIVFLDIQMPLMNGFEVMEAQPDTDYIIITAFESFAYAQEALRLGARDILLKPVDRNQFLESIARVVGWHFTSNDTVNQILEYIYANYNKKITLDDLAAETFMTTNHIARLFKEYTGTSIIRYLHKVRIDKAKDMLIEEEKSIQETCEEVGYDNMNNFYKHFRECTGMTPADFVKKSSGR